MYRISVLIGHLGTKRKQYRLSWWKSELLYSLLKYMYFTTYLIIFLGRIFIFMSAFCNRLLGARVMKLCFLPSLAGLFIVTGWAAGGSLLNTILPSTVDNLALGSGVILIISYTFLGHFGLGELSGVFNISLKCNKFDFTVMLKWVVPRKISKARACDTCSKLWPFTSMIWSPRFKPTSSAFDFLSTTDMKIPKLRSNPPRIWKFSGSSRFGRAKTTFRIRAFAAQAMFRRRSWPTIFSFSKPAT